MQEKFKSYLFTIIFLFHGIIMAQQAGDRSVVSDNVVLERIGSVYQQTIEVSVPFADRSPFITFSIKLFNVDVEDFDIELSWSHDGRSFSENIPVGFEEHGPKSSEFRVSELIFLDDAVQTIRYRITSHDIDEEIYLPLEYHFFRPPHEYSGEQKELQIHTERTGCDLPSYITRTGWNCPDGQDFSSGTPSFTNVTHLVVHHSAGVNNSSNWAAVVLSIWNYHRFTNGWSDIGYNFLIDPNGEIYEGRGGNDGYNLDVLPAATCGSNSGTMAVCLLGNFENVVPQEDAVSSLERLLAWKSEDRSIDPLASSQLNNYGVLNHIFGHRQGCATACPGENLFNKLPDIRQGVQQAVVQMCSPPAANVIYVDHSIDDNNDGESIGDNDGIVESGETIEIYLSLENSGGDTARNVVATLTSGASCVSFIDNNILFGDISPGAQANNGDFDIVFAPSCEGGIIVFPLTISSDNGTWFDTLYIEVFNNCRPLAIFTASPESGMAPLTVTYTSQSVNADLLEWTFPGGSPSAVSGPGIVEVTYLQPGTYSATLIAYNECGSDDTTRLVVADIINSAIDGEISPVLYPNPVSGLLHVELQRYFENARLEIINTGGKQMMMVRFSGNLVDVYTDDLASGIYIVRVTDLISGASWSAKVVKK